MNTIVPVGWAVVHALWQGTLIAGIAALALGLLRRRSPEARYGVACAALALMVVVPAITVMLGDTAIGSLVRRTVVLNADPIVNLSPLVAALPLVVRGAALLWLVGVALAVPGLVVSWHRASVWRSRDVCAADPILARFVEHVAEASGVRRRVATAISRPGSAPMVVGWRRPRILLPAETAARLAPADLRAVIAHELAHVRRADALANLLQVVAERLLFFHPAARWLSGVIRTEREFCCDDAAVRVGQDARGYARTLAGLGSARSDHDVVVAATSATLIDRIERLAGRPRHVLTPARGLMMLALACAVAAPLMAVVMVVPPSLPPGSHLDRPVPSAGAVTKEIKGMKKSV